MSMRSEATLVTAEQLESIDVAGKKVELVAGHLIVSEPPGMYHGVVASRLAVRLSAFVDAHDVGVVGTEVGFRIASDPDTVRAPDVWFASHARMAGEIPRGFARYAPELAVEVLSPTDRRGEVLAKVGQWITGGAELVWLIEPQRRNAQVFRPDGSVSLIGADESLMGEGVLSGFRCPLVELFPAAE